MTDDGLTTDATTTGMEMEDGTALTTDVFFGTRTLETGGESLTGNEKLSPFSFSDDDFKFHVDETDNPYDLLDDSSDSDFGAVTDLGATSCMRSTPTDPEKSDGNPIGAILQSTRGTSPVQFMCQQTGGVEASASPYIPHETSDQLDHRHRRISDGDQRNNDLANDCEQTNSSSGHPTSGPDDGGPPTLSPSTDPFNGNGDGSIPTKGIFFEVEYVCLEKGGGLHATAEHRTMLYFQQATVTAEEVEKTAIRLFFRYAQTFWYSKIAHPKKVAGVHVSHRNKQGTWRNLRDALEKEEVMITNYPQDRLKVFNILRVAVSVENDNSKKGVCFAHLDGRHCLNVLCKYSHDIRTFAKGIKRKSFLTFKRRRHHAQRDTGKQIIMKCTDHGLKPCLPPDCKKRRLTIQQLDGNDDVSDEEGTSQPNTLRDKLKQLLDHDKLILRPSMDADMTYLKLARGDQEHTLLFEVYSIMKLARLAGNTWRKFLKDCRDQRTTYTSERLTKQGIQRRVDEDFCTHQQIFEKDNVTILDHLKANFKEAYSNYHEKLDKIEETAETKKDNDETSLPPLLQDGITFSCERTERYDRLDEVVDYVLKDQLNARKFDTNYLENTKNTIWMLAQDVSFKILKKALQWSAQKPPAMTGKPTSWETLYYLEGLAIGDITKIKPSTPERRAQRRDVAAAYVALYLIIKDIARSLCYIDEMTSSSGKLTRLQQIFLNMKEHVSIRSLNSQVLMLLDSYAKLHLEVIHSSDNVKWHTFSRNSTKPLELIPLVGIIYHGRATMGDACLENMATFMIEHQLRRTQHLLTIMEVYKDVTSVSEMILRQLSTKTTINTAVTEKLGFLPHDWRGDTKNSNEINQKILRIIASSQPSQTIVDEFLDGDMKLADEYIEGLLDSWNTDDSKVQHQNHGTLQQPVTVPQ